MALSLGKLVLLGGAGVIGASTVYAKDVGVFDLFSGVTRVLRHFKSDTGSVRKPQNDSLMAQVNSLRNELQLLASNRPVTIITSGGQGANKYYIIIVIGVVGYGYVWWKGWKLPDLMFATRRTLSDACNSVGQQLDSVYSSVRTARKELSADISNLDTKLNEVGELTDSTQEIESKINRIEEKQSKSMAGINDLLVFAHQTQNGLIEDNSQVQQTPRRVVRSSTSQQSNGIGIGFGNGISGAAELTGPSTPSGIHVSEESNSGSSSSSSSRANGGSSVLQRQSFLSRTFSVTSSMLQRSGLKDDLREWFLPTETLSSAIGSGYRALKLCPERAALSKMGVNNGGFEDVMNKHYQVTTKVIFSLSAVSYGFLTNIGPPQVVCTLTFEPTHDPNQYFTDRQKIVKSVVPPKPLRRLLLM
ncbi:hypothetical protein LINGRAHAP2_LOCUS36935 [Linum grandiflorum]